MNRSPLRRRNEAKAEESTRVQAGIEARTAQFEVIEVITKADIDAEVKRQWIKDGLSGRS